MNMSVGFGDVVRAIELCVEIREKFFDPVHNAKAMYLDFKQDIRKLELRLKQYSDAFERAAVHLDTEKSFLAPEQAQIAAALKQEAKELAGDFKSTLEECDALLRKHVKIGSRGTGVLDNAFWYASAQSKVTNLRGRLQSHIHNIRLIVAPVDLQLTADILHGVNEIRELLMRQFGHLDIPELPEIPESIESRFREALCSQSPVTISEPSQIPLKDGVEALALCFRESTFERTVSGTSPKVDQYLNLLKAHWLVNILSDSPALSQTRPGHLYRRVVDKVKQSISKEYAREEVRHWARDCGFNLDDLSDSAFTIWPEKVVELPPSETEPMIGEEIVAQLILTPQYYYHKEELIVFAMNEYTLRIVLSQTYFDASQKEKERLVERPINLRSDGLVPLYTIASPPDKKWCLQITGGPGASSITPEAQNRGDAFELQKAFTGYEVASYFEDMSCAVTYRPPGLFLKRANQSEGCGEIQLWKWPDPQRSQIGQAEEEGQPSVRPRSNETIATRVIKSLDPSIFTVTGISTGEEVIVAEMPRPPLLMAFTKGDKEYIMWQMNGKLSSTLKLQNAYHPLVSDLEVSKSCQDQNLKVFRVVLVPKKRGFLVRRLSVPVTETRPDLGSWNLCALAIPGYLGHPNGVSSAVESHRCTYVVLDFPSPEAHTRFEKVLEVLTLRRRVQCGHFGFSQVLAESVQVEGAGPEP